MTDYLRTPDTPADTLRDTLLGALVGLARSTSSEPKTENTDAVLNAKREQMFRGFLSLLRSNAKIELKNVIIASVSPAVDEEGIPKESFSLKYSAVKWTYDELNIDGTKTGKVNIQGAWNLAKNTPNLT